MNTRGGATRGEGGADEVVIEESHLDRVLSGGLPCAVCRYELQGLSIRGVCPECGTPVQATILFRVDPKAKEFRPLFVPALTANGLLLWSVGGLVAALAFWLAHLVGYANAEWGFPMRPDFWREAAVVGIGISCAGSLGLIHPVRGGAARKTMWAVLGLLAYGVLLVAAWRLVLHDRVSALVYIDTPPSLERVVLRGVMGVSFIGVFLGFRPQARELVERCLLLRTGRVSRQTLLAMAVAAMVGLAGDGLHGVSISVYGERTPSVLTNVGTLLILLSGVFILVGLVHAQSDSWQIRKSILAPSPTLEELIEPEGEDQGA